MTVEKKTPFSSFSLVFATDYWVHPASSHWSPFCWLCKKKLCAGGSTLFPPCIKLKHGFLFSIRNPSPPLIQTKGTGLSIMKASAIWNQIHAASALGNGGGGGGGGGSAAAGRGIRMLSLVVEEVAAVAATTPATSPQQQARDAAAAGSPPPTPLSLGHYGAAILNALQTLAGSPAAALVANARALQAAAGGGGGGVGGVNQPSDPAGVNATTLTTATIPPPPSPPPPPSTALTLLGGHSTAASGGADDVGGVLLVDERGVTPEGAAELGFGFLRAVSGDVEREELEAAELRLSAAAVGIPSPLSAFGTASSAQADIDRAENALKQQIMRAIRLNDDPTLELKLEEAGRRADANDIFVPLDRRLGTRAKVWLRSESYFHSLSVLSFFPFFSFFFWWGGGGGEVHFCSCFKRRESVEECNY